MLEVLDVVLEVYHTQHIFKYTMCVLLEVVDARGGGGGTPYDDQCTMLGGLDPHFRAWLDPIGSIFELGSIP